MRLTLVLALASLVLESDAGFDFHSLVGRHSNWVHDATIALRSLARRAPPRPPSSLHKRVAQSARCIAVPSKLEAGVQPGDGQSPTDGSPTDTDDDTGAPKPTSTPGGGSGGNSTTKSSWKVAQYYAGDSFFDGWDFFTDADPTNGVVDYVDEATARANNLIYTNDAGNAIMRVEDTPQVAGNRKSIRVQTKYSFNGALLIMDALHYPFGCSLWPAWWTNGPSWPTTGEIDIMEGVNDVNVNQATLHTRAGCSITESDLSLATGRSINGLNCDVAATGNAGCGYQLFDGPNYGQAFNDNDGGVYATLWDEKRISVWWFARGNIPSDITSKTPLPERWGTPWAHWPATNCNTMDFFRDHKAIFDTTLCGDWAGNTWNSVGAPGQSESCAARTGVATCIDFVRQRGDAFKDAYWEIKSVAIYQPK